MDNNNIISKFHYNIPYNTFKIIQDALINGEIFYIEGHPVTNITYGTEITLYINTSTKNTRIILQGMDIYSDNFTIKPGFTNETNDDIIQNITMFISTNNNTQELINNFLQIKKVIIRL